MLACESNRVAQNDLNNQKVYFVIVLLKKTLRCMVHTLTADVSRCSYAD